MSGVESAQMLMIKQELRIEDYIGRLQTNMRLYDEMRAQLLELEEAKSHVLKNLTTEELEKAAARRDEGIAMVALAGVIIDRKIEELKGNSTMGSEAESNAYFDHLKAKTLRGDKIRVSAVSPSRHAIETLPYPTHGMVVREGRISEISLDLATGGSVSFKGNFRHYEASPLVDRDIDYASPFDIRTIKSKR